MQLHNDMVSTELKLRDVIGFLARRRTTFTLLVPLGLVALASPTVKGLVVGAVLVVLGELLRIWAAGYITKSVSLTTAGPFRRIRHPLYLGSLTIALGYCSMSGQWISFPIVIVLFFVFFGAAIITEEEYLTGVFGGEYSAYKASTGLLFPSFKGCPLPAGGFSAKRIISNKEHIVLVSSLVISLLFYLRFFFK